MEWELSEDPDDTYAEMSVLWLLGWAMVLPITHPMRLLAYGFLPTVLFVVSGIWFPGASLFGPFLVTADFALPVPRDFLPYMPAMAWAIVLVSFVVLAFLLCAWQRDVAHRFREPLGRLILASAARLPEYLVQMLINLAAIIGGLVAVGYLRIFGWSVDGPADLVVGLAFLCLIAWIYVRVSFLGPLLASRSLLDALKQSWHWSAGKAVSLALAQILIGVCWFAVLWAIDIVAVIRSARDGAWTALAMADCGIVIATVYMMIWMSAVPALVLRRYLDLDGTEADAFV